MHHLSAPCRHMAMYPLFGDEKANPLIVGMDITSWAMYAEGAVSSMVEKEK